MLTNSRSHKVAGFTLVEVLVTIVLVTIAIVGTLQGLQSISRNQVRANTADLLQRLALDKINDLGLLQTPTSAGGSGDYSDRGYPDVTWTITDNATSVTDLDSVTVTSTRASQSQTVTKLLYVRPQTLPTSTSTTATSTSSGG